MPRVSLFNPADSNSELSAKHTEHRTAVKDLVTDGERKALNSLLASLGRSDNA